MKKTDRLFLFSVLTTVLISALLIGWVAQWTDGRLRGELLSNARLAASAINRDHLATLSGSQQDLELPSYLHIKTQLSLMRQARPQCRFLYLLGQRPDGTVFFYMDSLLPHSKDYAPPGLLYEEVSADYLQAFNSGKATVVGPVTDRWGTLVTALVPIRLAGSESLIMLGMDVDASDWHSEIAWRCAVPFGAMLVLMIMLFMLNARRPAVREGDEQAEKHRLFFENSPLGIIYYDSRGRITNVNPALLALFSSSRQKLIGRRIDDILGEEFSKEMLNTLIGESGCCEGEYHSAPGGKAIFIKTRWRPLMQGSQVESGFGIIEQIPPHTKTGPVHEE